VERCLTQQQQAGFSDSPEKEAVEPMIHKIAAIVLFVQDLDSCTAFYRDTLQLP
jgi:hypothetical protein